MRTTLDIEADVLMATKEMARRRRQSLGKVVSDLLRRVMINAPSNNNPPTSNININGFQPFASEGVVITNEQIDCLRDIEGA